jgi:hypothetical protein
MRGQSRLFKLSRGHPRGTRRSKSGGSAFDPHRRPILARSGHRGSGGGRRRGTGLDAQPAGHGRSCVGVCPASTRYVQTGTLTLCEYLLAGGVSPHLHFRNTPTFRVRVIYDSLMTVTLRARAGPVRALEREPRRRRGNDWFVQTKILKRT